MKELISLRLFFILIILICFRRIIIRKILYYASTGNNLYIAKQFGGELLSIPQLVKNEEFDIEDDAVGIIFPVFYATSPKMLREFVKKVNIKTNYLFLICSYGSDGDQNAL